MYVAGTDTTSESLYWAFLYMVMYPDVQERVYDEVHEKLGESHDTQYHFHKNVDRREGRACDVPMRTGESTYSMVS